MDVHGKRRVPQPIHERSAHHQPSQGLVGAGHSFGEGDHVGFSTEALAAEPVAQPPEGVDDLVGAEQHAVGIADAAQLLPVALGRDERPASVLHRLGDDHGHGVGAGGNDRVLDGSHAVEFPGGPAGGRGAFQGVGDTEHVVGQHRQERVPEVGNARQRQSAQGRAVVGPPAGHHLVASFVAVGQVIAAGELEGRLNRLGSRAHKEHPVKIAGRGGGDHRRGLYRRRVRHAPIRVEGEPVHLL